jgi:phage FluMu protein Com
MATDKTFTVAGVSKHKGEYKVRFANDIMRIKNLDKSGHEDIRLCELESAMSKYDAIKAISTMDEFQDAAAQSCITEYLEDKAPKAKVAKTVATKAKAPAKAPKATKTAAKAVDTSDLEDAPF